MSPPTVAHVVHGYGHILVVFMIIVEASHHLWFMAPAAAAGVMSPGQDIGVGAAKFNFRKYPVLFPTFISSLRLKFTTRLPYSLRTQNPHRTLFRKVAFMEKSIMPYRVFIN